MRLIDADALELDVQNLWMQNEISNGDWVGFREMLNSQETISEFDGDINKVMVKGIEYFPQKTGKWINANDGKWNTCEVLKCSECGEIDPRMYRSDLYCPNCGTRMECEEE